MKLDEFGRMLLGIGLGYLRWTQLVPMIVVWGFTFIGLLGAILVSFQEQSITALAWLHQATAPIPGLHDAIGRWMQDSGAITSSGGIHLTDEQLTPLMVRGWALLSLALFLFSGIWRWITNSAPRPRRPLRKKILWAALASIAVVALTILVLMMGGAGNDINPSEMILMGIIGMAILWSVAIYSLTVAHVLGWLIELVDSGSFSAQSSQQQKRVGSPP